MTDKTGAKTIKRKLKADNIQYLYIIKTPIAKGEILVEGRTSTGKLHFGFRTFDSLFWQEKARTYTGTKYIPAFVAKMPPFAS